MALEFLRLINEEAAPRGPRAENHANFEAVAEMGQKYGVSSVIPRRGGRLAQNGGEGEKHHSNSQVR
jgi:hypothetical protein